MGTRRGARRVGTAWRQGRTANPSQLPRKGAVPRSREQGPSPPTLDRGVPDSRGHSVPASPTSAAVNSKLEASYLPIRNLLKLELPLRTKIRGSAPDFPAHPRAKSRPIAFPSFLALLELKSLGSLSIAPSPRKHKSKRPGSPSAYSPSHGPCPAQWEGHTRDSFVQ